jgi:hypothetical protein
MKNAGLTSSKNALVTFLLGFLSCGWNLMVVPVALTRGICGRVVCEFFRRLVRDFCSSFCFRSGLQKSEY